MTKLYIQIANINMDTLLNDVAKSLKGRFEDVLQGGFFIRTNKAGDGQIYIKIGKRNALMVLDAKGNSPKIKKFKSDDKVVPMDAQIALRVSELTEAGAAEAARRLTNGKHMEALKAPREHRLSDKGWPYPSQPQAAAQPANA